MLLSKSVALSILGTMMAQALVIPSVGDVIDVFEDDDKAKNLQETVKQEVSQGIDKVTTGVNGVKSKLGEATKDILGKLNIDLVHPSQMAPLFSGDREIISNKYIIVFKEDVEMNQADFHKEWVALQHLNSMQESDDNGPQEFLQSVGHHGGIADSFHIANGLSGYFGHFLDSTIDLIRRHPAVKFVEKDSTVHASEFDTQKGAPWGLARVSHREPLSLNSFNQYLYDSEGGSGVTAYIIDTGININHEEFGGRAEWGSTIPAGDADVDGNGHGTHCAGTIGSTSYGVAKDAKLVAVKVLRSNGSGSMSDVVKGVEFAAKSHQEEVKAGKKGFKGSAANMSLGGGKSTALDLAVNAAVKAGLNFAVAAGNENQDACNTSPAAAENAITVGASTISDARAYFSNYGKCVDIFAPGLNILSTYIGSTSATATLSGTSMASPHICGLLSYFISLQPSADSEFFTAADAVTPAQLKKNLIKFASPDKLSDIPEDTPNLLAFNGAGHNLTEFWGLEQEVNQESKHQVKEQDNKLPDLSKLLHDLENDPLVHQVEDFVKNVYDASL